METKSKSKRSLVQMMSFPVKILEIPVNMMKLPVNVMNSSMKTVTESMQEIQRKTKANAEVDSEECEESGEGKSSAFRKASQTAMMPYLEVFKIPRSVLASSVKSIAETMQEIRNQPESTNGEVSEAGTDDCRGAAVPLTPDESALEAALILTEEAANVPGALLWQVGRPGRADFQGKWVANFDYEIGADLDAIDNPALPHFITVGGRAKTRGATARLNLHFSLERDHPPGELVFSYDRWGAEKDLVALDGALLVAVRGAGKGKFKSVAISLPGLSSGAHIISVTATGQTEAGGHRLDHLKLVSVTERADGAKTK